MEGSSDGLELSLKLYHAGELQLGYQQLMTEALQILELIHNHSIQIAGLGWSRILFSGTSIPVALVIDHVEIVKY